MHCYAFFVRVISLTTTKMVVHGLARAMERTTNLSLISHFVKKSKNILYQIENLHVITTLKF
jgi:hypothetical protein